MQLLLGTVLIVRVLGKVGGGFRIPGNLRVFLFEFLLRSVYKELHADHETGAADNK